MKRLVLTLWLVIISGTSAMSQVNHYIIKTVERDNMVYLYVNPKAYENMEDSEKNLLLQTVVNQYYTGSICVVCAHDVEMWLSVGGVMKMVDSWNKDSVRTLSSIATKQVGQTRSLQHPWFLNFGGGFNYNVDDNASTILYNAYGRLGCYLLKGRWDMALNLLMGYNKGAKDTNGRYSNSIGVDTRVYILKGKAINPFAGVGLAYAFGSDQSSFTIPISVGMSISVKQNGFIDLCYQYNNVTKSAIIVGYTYMHK